MAASLKWVVLLAGYAPHIQASEYPVASDCTADRQAGYGVAVGGLPGVFCVQFGVWQQMSCYLEECIPHKAVMCVLKKAASPCYVVHRLQLDSSCLVGSAAGTCQGQARCLCPHTSGGALLTRAPFCHRLPPQAAGRWFC
jgi:hypothetical protein